MESESWLLTSSDCVLDCCEEIFPNSVRRLAQIWLVGMRSCKRRGPLMCCYSSSSSSRLLEVQRFTSPFFSWLASCYWWRLRFLVVPFPPCGPPLLGCLLAWTSSVLLAPCFLFLSLSWVLSFYKVYQGFIKGCCFLHLLNPTHNPPNLQVWFYITDCLWTILYIYYHSPCKRRFVCKPKEWRRRST